MEQTGKPPFSRDPVAAKKPVISPRCQTKEEKINLKRV